MSEKKELPSVKIAKTKFVGEHQFATESLTVEVHAETIDEAKEVAKEMMKE